MPRCYKRPISDYSTGVHRKTCSVLDTERKDRAESDYRLSGLWGSTRFPLEFVRHWE